MNKNILRISLGLVLTLCVAQPGLAHEQPPRMITVTGDAQLKVVPDEVLITLGVETFDRDVELAKKSNDEKIKGIVTFSQSHGVELKHIQTSHISLEPRRITKYNSEKKRDELDYIDYFVRKTVIVTLRDVSRFDLFLSNAISQGATHIHGIQFRTTELRKYKDQARALAIKAAQEKATDMASGLNQTIGVPQSISEYPTHWYSWYNRSWWGGGYSGRMAQNVVQNVNSGAGGNMEDGVSLGQISVNAKVNISFLLNE